MSHVVQARKGRAGAGAVLFLEKACSPKLLGSVRLQPGLAFRTAGGQVPVRLAMAS